MTKVLYPGSFDPITKGHMSIIEEASRLFDVVVIAVLQNPLKKTNFFTLEERAEIIKELYKNRENITIISESDVTVDIAIKQGCHAIIRGLRNISDYNYERELAQINKDLSDNKISTICLFANSEYEFVSSSMVKEILNLGKDITKYVDPLVKKRMLIKKGSFQDE